MLDPDGLVCSFGGGVGGWGASGDGSGYKSHASVCLTVVLVSTVLT